LIGSDLEALRERLAQIEPRVWVGLNIVAAQILAWHEAADDIFLGCQREVESGANFAPDLVTELDRFDYLLAVRGAFRRPGALRDQAQFRRLIAESWSRPFPAVRGLLHEILADIDRRPAAWLERFDWFRAGGAALLSWFGQLLAFERNEREPAHDPGDPETLARQGRDYVLAELPAEYPALRSRLLHYCLAEFIDPAWIAAAVANVRVSSTDGRSLGEVIRTDWPLRLVYDAVHTLHG
jgi:hypothetical protein